MKRVFNPLPKSVPRPRIRRTPEQALKAVTSKDGLGVYASADRLFKGAVFGRDSLEVAGDLMYIKPRLVRQILLVIASLQGENFNQQNEEEPGKIIHEYRTPKVDGKPLDATSREIYDRLSEVWGGDENSLAYYGSVDATPHFIKVLSVYCQEYGMEILLEQVKTRSGGTRSMMDIYEGAIDWLVKHLDDSKSGFVEYQRKNPKGIENQVWKDSREFYVHKDGSFANHEQPISSIEVQSMAYDALTLAAELLPSRRELEKYARKIGRLVFELLWMEDVDYFALGTDFDEDGKLRIIETVTANPAAMLESRIFDNLPEDRREKYISAIAREIMGTAFLTDAGIRSRSLSEAELIKRWDYHGSFVTWPKESYSIAAGLGEQGLLSSSGEVKNRIVNVVNASQSYGEFFYVDARGRVLGVPTRSRSHGDIIPVDSTNKPERIQAWTVSAIVAITKSKKNNQVSQRIKRAEAWREKLDKEIATSIPHMPLLKSKRELSARYPFYPYVLNEEDF